MGHHRKEKWYIIQLRCRSRHVLFIQKKRKGMHIYNIEEITWFWGKINRSQRVTLLLGMMSISSQLSCVKSLIFPGWWIPGRGFTTIMYLLKQLSSVREGTLTTFAFPQMLSVWSNQHTTGAYLVWHILNSFTLIVINFIILILYDFLPRSYSCMCVSLCYRVSVCPIFRFLLIVSWSCRIHLPLHWPKIHLFLTLLFGPNSDKKIIKWQFVVMILLKFFL